MVVGGNLSRTQGAEPQALGLQRALLKPTQRVPKPSSAPAGSILQPGPGATQVATGSVPSRLPQLTPGNGRHSAEGSSGV